MRLTKEEKDKIIKEIFSPNKEFCTIETIDRRYYLDIKKRTIESTAKKKGGRNFKAKKSRDKTHFSRRIYDILLKKDYVNHIFSKSMTKEEFETKILNKSITKQKTINLNDLSYLREIRRVILEKKKQLELEEKEVNEHINRLKKSHIALKAIIEKYGK